TTTNRKRHRVAVTHYDTKRLYASPFSAQGVATETSRTLYVGVQNGTDYEGMIEGELAEQATQALRNVLTVLEAAGVGPEQVAKLTVYLHSEADPQVGFAAAQIGRAHV